MSEHEGQPELAEHTRAVLREAISQIEDATFDVLVKKPRRQTEFFVHVAGDDGRPKPVRLRYQAIPPKELDELIAAHPATGQAKRDGAQWDKDSFPPALIAAVSVTPKLSVEQARELIESPDWAPGESGALFQNAWAVCTAGLDVPFNAGG